MKSNSSWAEIAGRAERSARTASPGPRDRGNLDKLFPGRAEAQRRPVRVADTYIISNNNRRIIPGVGMHTGLAILSDDGDDEKNALYDPNGSFPAKDIGTGRFLIGPDASLEDYEKFQLTDGPDVTVRRYDTTPEQEQQIMERIDRNGGGGGVSCTQDVAAAVEGIGPFRDVKRMMFPSAFDAHLEERPTYVQKYRPGDRRTDKGMIERIIVDSLLRAVPRNSGR